MGPVSVAVLLLGLAVAAFGTRLVLDLFEDGDGGHSTHVASVPTSVSATGARDGQGGGTPPTPEAVAGDPPVAVGSSHPVPSPAPPTTVSAPPPSSPAPTTATPAPPQSSPPAPSPTGTSPSPSSTAPAPSTAVAYEDKVLAIVNTERATAGCGPVKADAALRDLARAHSNDMADRGYFAHDTPEGKTPWDRAKAADVTYLAAENIARGQPTPEAVMEAWMNSPGHRANILNCEFDKLGVGVRTGAGGPWWTQEFGR